MRSRNIKPGFFLNDKLAEVDFGTRLLFTGLWCYADREGRFEWIPKRIKAAIFPYDDKVNIDKMLCNLMALHVITKHDNVGYVENFNKHQNPHPHESKSVLPEKPQQNQCNDMSVTLHGMPLTCNADSLIPDSLIPDIRIHKTITSELKKNSTLKVTPWPNEEKDFETFIKTQTYIPPILDYGWWDAVSVAINGISIPFVESEFAKMAAWIKENPRRGPTQKGVKRFVRVWLEKSAEDRRRKSAKG